MVLKNKYKGFTLIELLVVIAIIGMLSSVVFASLGAARAKGRDAKRKSELNQMAVALELYFDTYGGYPLDTYNGWEQTCKTTTNDIGKIVAQGFMSRLPCDPLNSGSFGYFFDPESYNSFPSAPLGYDNSYCLWTVLEGGGNYGKFGGGYTSCPGA